MSRGRETPTGGIGVRSRWVALLVAMAAAGPGTVGARAQEPRGAEPGTRAVDEVTLLQEASSEEAQGKLPLAARTLEQILSARPASVPALLALERVLLVQGRLEALVPRVEAAVAVEPGSALLNQVRVRTYAALDREKALRSAERSWIAASPNTEVAYREVAKIEEGRGEYDRARAVLEEGRQKLRRPDALALELGDLMVTLHEPELAVAEWDRAIGRDGHGLSQVRRRLRALPDGGAALLAPLAKRLMAGPATGPRLMGAVDLAVEAGLQDQAEQVAGRILQGMTLEERSTFLTGIARRADAGHRTRLAYWAYRKLVDTEETLAWVAERKRASSRDTLPPPGAPGVPTPRTLALRSRLAELALAVGDTAGAADSYAAVARASAAGSSERREAAALRVELLAGNAPDRATDALRQFRSDFPSAPELDQAAAAVGLAVLDAGRPTDAASLISGVRGPRTALLRARMALMDGNLDAARTAYLNAVPGLRGAEATDVLTLATLLGRLSPPAGARLGAALERRDAGEPGKAVDILTAPDSTLSEQDRPALLEFAARLADDAGLRDDARRVRRELLADYPRSMEAPKALLALASAFGGEAERSDEARELLERLIMEYPRSALVPQARQELARLGRDDADGSTKE